ncbi:hypothetical protein H696_00482 [Fonticula alba]|uniref:SH3 domain-containing protein n=1 Tax=Fonticula alba TaxID=691883 RepID=A0A058ZHF4_FONAL|nr:hypothetical protein H696_00482 [Fonticula alba]KCV72912.1 hypothetical protein H696_00482 [Fonticula alba]|eukprot:XP_009492613.1 hypothetical protein H696_00482 [Fonticula alba]
MQRFDKKFGQLRQWTAEKAGKAVATTVDDEFSALDRSVDSKKEALEKLTDGIKPLLPQIIRPDMVLMPGTMAAHSAHVSAFQTAALAMLRAAVALEATPPPMFASAEDEVVSSDLKRSASRSSRMSSQASTTSFALPPAQSAAEGASDEATPSLSESGGAPSIRSYDDDDEDEGYAQRLKEAQNSDNSVDSAAYNRFATALRMCSVALENCGSHSMDLENTIHRCLYQQLDTELSQDIRDWAKIKGKLESRRLDSDAKHHRFSKTAASSSKYAEAEREHIDARNKYNQTLDDARTMMRFLVADRSQGNVADIHQFASAMHTFFLNSTIAWRDALQSLEDLEPSLPKTDLTTNPFEGANNANNFGGSPSTGTCQCGGASGAASNEPPFASVEDPNAPTLKVRALYAFEPESSDELPLARGDIIKVLRRVDTHWWIGERESDSRIGLFPVPFVEPVK